MLVEDDARRGASRTQPDAVFLPPHSCPVGTTGSRGAAIVPEHTGRRLIVNAEPTLRIPSSRDPERPATAHGLIDQRGALAARPFLALPEARQALLLHVSGLLDEIVFGNVVIVMHDGNVIQIETSEKIRLT